MSKSIAILGGGIAGMSAAHELIERGYSVTVYEKQDIYVGGKARSVDYYGKGKEGYDLPLPGEHGFRFFPGFYKHIIDTMERTPFSINMSCADNLVGTKTTVMANLNKPSLLTLVNFPKSLADLTLMIKAYEKGMEITGLDIGDIEFFAQKLWELASSSPKRRKEEYERISWMDFTEAKSRSKAYNQYFVTGLTRTLVAAKANEVSAKTGGNILMQLIFLMANPTAEVDRVLNKPSNEAWLYPWKDYLLSKGVIYNNACSVEGIECEEGKISSVIISTKEGFVKRIQADYYISCVPVERMVNLLTYDLLSLAPSLKGLKELSSSTSWMTGIQFFLNEDIIINEGHTIYTDSPWALTSISQLQFWTDYSLEGRGNGKVKGVLSVDISDWMTEGLNGKTANTCASEEEVMQEVWEELKESLNVEGKIILSDNMIEDYYLDRDIGFKSDNVDIDQYDDGFDNDEIRTTNAEPLLVNKINTWDLRPEAYTEIPNLMLASDYVRTNTDLATMEGANEAARRAVNAILDYESYFGDKCEIWALHEPDLLRVYRWYDQKRYDKGLPWKGSSLPFSYKILNILNISWLSVKGIIKKIIK